MVSEGTWVNPNPGGPTKNQILACKIRNKWQEVKRLRDAVPGSHDQACKSCGSFGLSSYGYESSCTCGFFEAVDAKAAAWSQLYELLDQL